MSGLKWRISRWAWARRLTAGVFLGLLVLGQFEWFPWVKGTTSATALLEVVPFTDPLAALEVTLATRSLQFEMLLGAGFLLLVCALVGPLFCAWVCPLGLILDLNDAVHRRVMYVFSNKPVRDTVSLPRSIRFGVLGAVIGFALIARLPLFQALSPINVVSWAVVFLAWPALVLVVAIMVVEYFVPRVWCRLLCPLGALYSWVGRYGLLRVHVNPREAGKSPCRQCTYHCPMGIAVMEDYTLAGAPAIDHPDCTRCGDCVDACPRGSVLRLGFSSRFPSNGAMAEACREQGCPSESDAPDHRPHASPPVLNREKC